MPYARCSTLIRAMLKGKASKLWNKGKSGLLMLDCIQFPGLLVFWNQVYQKALSCARSRGSALLFRPAPPAEAPQGVGLYARCSTLSRAMTKGKASKLGNKSKSGLFFLDCIQFPYLRFPEAGLSKGVLVCAIRRISAPFTRFGRNPIARAHRDALPSTVSLPANRWNG